MGTPSFEGASFAGHRQVGSICYQFSQIMAIDQIQIQQFKMTLPSHQFSN
jgi:hypothetical protein